jgi:thiol-disulfide isomerase/thioredoxin
MMERQVLSPRGLILAGIAVVAGACAGLAAVYVSKGFPGNGEPVSVAACAARQAAQGVGELAKGEVAAFRVFDAPTDFSQLAFKAPDGAGTTLASFAGRTVLVNLWATWCVPCRSEMPALARLQSELGDDRFTVATVNIDIGESGLARARSFLEETNAANLAFYSDPTTGAFKDLKGRGLALGLPTTILVDPRGCGIGTLQGPAQWDSEDAKALIRAAIAASSA